jgi:hypothetical protein
MTLTTKVILWVIVTLLYVFSVVAAAVTALLHREATAEEAKQYPMPDYPGFCRRARNRLAILVVITSALALYLLLCLMS